MLALGLGRYSSTRGGLTKLTKQANIPTWKDNMQKFP